MRTFNQFPLYLATAVVKLFNTLIITISTGFMRLELYRLKHMTRHHQLTKLKKVKHNRRNKMMNNETPTIKLQPIMATSKLNITSLLNLNIAQKCTFDVPLLPFLLTILYLSCFLCVVPKTDRLHQQPHNQ